MKSVVASILLLSMSLCLFAQPSFENVAESIGVLHRATVADTNMPAQGGAAWFDFNNDGWYDLYLTGGNSPDALYKNNGNGAFTDVSALSGINALQNKQTNGVTTGDVNRDGWNDVFITTVKELPNYLLLNNGDGTFSSQLNWAGQNDMANSYSSSFGDMDLDGWLDLYVCNWSRNMLVTIDGPEVSVDSDPNFFYLNQGDGTFASRGDDFGIDDSLGCALGVMFTDYDNDHDLDIIVANDFGFFNGNSPNRAYRNEYPLIGFTERSFDLGLDQEMNGMGVAKADLNEDGALDYFVSNIRTDKLMINSLVGFTDEAVTRGIQNDSVWFQNLTERDFNVGWGAGFLDIDNDMDEDLFVANGSLQYEHPYPTLDSNKLWLNDGHGEFTDVSFSASVADPYISRALAYCDYDLDGDLDVFVGITDSITGITTSRLYRNDTDVEDWLQVKATGVQQNTNGIGVKVYVHDNGFSQMREIGGESSFNSQHWQVAHFGLGGNHTVDSVDVVWPGGNVDKIYDLDSNQFIEVVEGQGILITGVDEAKTGNMKVYPNPFSDKLTVTGENLITLELFDSQGTSVMHFQAEVIHEIDSSKLVPGNYLLKAKYFDGSTSTRKLIKQ